MSFAEAALAMLETAIFWRNMVKYTPMWQNNTENDSKPAAHIQLSLRAASHRERCRRGSKLS